MPSATYTPVIIGSETKKNGEVVDETAEFIIAIAQQKRRKTKREREIRNLLIFGRMYKKAIETKENDGSSEKLLVYFETAPDDDEAKMVEDWKKRKAGVALCVGLGISNTIIFRFRVLRRGRMSQKRIITMIALTYIPSLAIIILPFTSPWNFVEVQRTTAFEHPTYDLSVYEPYVGFSQITSFQFLSATFLLVIGAYAIPAVSGFLTTRVIHLINKNRGMSLKTKEQSKTLAYGLACQTFLPVTCYIPIPTCYIYSQSTGAEMLMTGEQNFWIFD
ncbi:hypothetical protein L3Y34_017758 [Caenorhabditis briggsae]|uniref:G protein-coupled receptor n=1 Tax=Caenorhabditis briggsae TaxID=6238 RepID=A0AAE9DIC2_CAEBR|nr:hypothetical protein L3Y34_017758 [Caenorhabditis briggsae]